MTHSPTISAPVAMITPDNHGGLVLITNAFGLILVLIFLVIRILARVIISPPFDKDDLALVVATAFCIIHSSLVFAAVSHGFGKTTDLIEEADLLSSQKLVYTSDIFFLITMWCSKCAVALTFIRLTPQAKHKKVAKGILGATTVWLVLSVFLVSLRCDVSQPWLTCQDIITRWKVVNALDIVLEVALFFMSILLVKDLQMDMKRKVFVVTAFGLRLAIITAIVLRLHYLAAQHTSNNPALASVFFMIWTLVEADFSIISGNIACLKPFMAAFNTSYGGVEEINALSRRGDRTDKSGLSTTSSMKLSRFTRSRKDTETPKESRRASVPQIRGDTLGNEAEITHEDAESVGSHGSRQMIIQKEITWNVEYHTPSPAKESGPNLQYNV